MTILKFIDKEKNLSTMWEKVVKCGIFFLLLSGNNFKKRFQ